MLQLTRKADYAFVAMAELARRRAQRTSARGLAETIGVPLPMLTNVLHQLLQSGLVTSSKGVKGGYQLARQAEEISLADMIEAIQGRFKLTICCSGEGHGDERECDLESSCRIREPVRRVHRGLRAYLSRVTLAQLVSDSVPRDGLVELTLPTEWEEKKQPATIPASPTCDAALGLETTLNN